MTDPLARFRLDGRTALVTGARREIGRAIALALAGVGARVAVHHAGTPEEARDAAGVVAEIGAGFGAEIGADRAQAFAADFTAPHAGRDLAAAVTAAMGPIDILVINASIEILQGTTEITRESFEAQVNVNLWATLELMQALVPPMAAAGWGRVVTIGSVQQAFPSDQMLVYAGAKAMQHNWAVNLARQYGRQGVTVNNIAPGAIATARNAGHLGKDGGALLARTPAGRYGTPDDLVGAALLLCTPAGEFITGANLFVDGGRLIG